jgi:hypothetical protein
LLSILQQQSFWVFSVLVPRGPSTAGCENVASQSSISQNPTNSHSTQLNIAEHKP